jgi:hypothetical protein
MQLEVLATIYGHALTGSPYWGCQACVRGTPSHLIQTCSTCSPDQPWPAHICWTGCQSPAHLTGPDPNWAWFTCSLNWLPFACSLDSLPVHSHHWCAPAHPPPAYMTHPTVGLLGLPTKTIRLTVISTLPLGTCICYPHIWNLGNCPKGWYICRAICPPPKIWSQACMTAGAAGLAWVCL